MGKFTNNVDPSGTSQTTTITTFQDVDLNDANVTNLSATTLSISEGINSEGLIKANEGEFVSVKLGDLKIQNNIISLSDDSILDEIILNANKITLSSDGANVNLAKITTTELEIKDSLITLSSDNVENNVDRGILFNYPVSILTDSSGYRSGFIGFNSDNIFRMITGISTITDNNFYNNTGAFTLGTLEIGTLLTNNISSTGDINILSSDTDKSVIIGNGLDSKTIINSNLEIKGTLEAETFAFFNSNVSTYAKKNLLLFLDNSVKIDNISENNGIYTLTLNEDRVFSVGGYIYFEGIDLNNTTNQSYLEKFNGIHTILSVENDFLSITIQLESGLDIPSFSSDVYALIGSLNAESLTTNSGLSVLSYEDNTKVLREHKINYEYNSNNYLDSSWLFNRNLKTENTILVKNNKIIYDNDNDYSRIYVRDDGELYFKNNTNNEYKLSNNDEDDIFNLNAWGITNDEIVHTFNNVCIGSSTMSSFYKLSVKGNVEITGQLDALAGNLVANNIDASGSLSVNGFKSTNINTQNLTIEDRNFQVGYLDVSLIDSVDDSTNEIKSRIDHKLETDTYIYFQNTNVYFSNNNSIDGFRKINVVSSTSVQIYDDDGITISDINYKTMNQVRYIGLKNLIGSDIIDNRSSEFSGSDSIRVRIYMLSNITFKYSYNGGYTYQVYPSNIVLGNNISLDDGLIIKFLDNSNLEEGDYFEFDCCPQYVISFDPDTGALIEPDETNFLGEFGKVFSSNELLDSGFEVMIRNPNNYTLESQKLSYYYTDSNNKFWKLTDTLNINGSLKLNVDSSGITFGEDEEISLTHVHDTGLLLNQDKRLLYGSSNEYIYGDGLNLNIHSSNVVNINSLDTIFTGNLSILGSINQVITINALGQISGGTLTDNVASLSGGALSNITSIDGSGELTMGTITMTGFSVDADGDVTSKSINNSNGGIINTGSITGATTISASGLITANGGITVADGQILSSNSVDINGGSIDGTTIGSTTTSTGAFTTISASGQISGGTLTDSVASLSNGTFNNLSRVNSTNGILTLDGNTGINLNENGVSIISISDSRSISTANTSEIDLDCSGQLSLNSSNGIINIGNDNVDQNINIGTNGERLLTIGNNEVNTEVIIKSGSTGKVSIGTIKSGTWEGDIISPVYGGLGINTSSISKGGLLSGINSSTFGITGVGANNTVLIADSSATGGISWSSVTNDMLAGGISNSKLSNSSIVVSDGSNSSSISLGDTVEFSGTNFTNTSGIISINDNSISLAQLADLSRGGIIYGSASGTSELSKGSSNTVLISNGTDISWSSVTNDMLAGGISNSKLSNSSIVVSDGSNSSLISLGDTITYNGSGLVTVSESNKTITIGCSVSLNDLTDVNVSSNIITLGSVSTTGIYPSNDNTTNLGSESSSFADAYIDGVIYASKLNNGVSLTIPTTDGLNNQVLSTNGSGTLSWSTVQSSLTFGIADGNSVIVDGSVSAGDYVKFTSNGIVGVSDLKSDLSLNNVENTALSTWSGSSNISTVGEINYKRKTLSTQSVDTTLNVSDSGATILQSDDVVLTLPSSSAGVTYSFIWVGVAGTGFSISPSSGEKILGSVIDNSGSVVLSSNDGGGTVDKKVNLGGSSKVGNKITLLGDGNNWIITDGLGDWSFEI